MSGRTHGDTRWYVFCNLQIGAQFFKPITNPRKSYLLLNFSTIDCHIHSKIFYSPQLVFFLCPSWIKIFQISILIRPPHNKSMELVYLSMLPVQISKNPGFSRNLERRRSILQYNDSTGKIFSRKDSMERFPEKKNVWAFWNTLYIYKIMDALHPPFWLISNAISDSYKKKKSQFYKYWRLKSNVACCPWFLLIKCFLIQNIVGVVIEMKN